jgi:hypothetical protein
MTEVIPRFSVTVNGDRNPARVAYAWLKAACPDDMINHESFHRMMDTVGEVEDFGRGFIVHGIDDLARLCLLGGFEIVASESGKISARKSQNAGPRPATDNGRHEA